MMTATCYLTLVPKFRGSKMTGFRIEKVTKGPPQTSNYYVKLLLEVPESAFSQEVKVTIPDTAIGMVEVVVEVEEEVTEETTTIETTFEEEE